MQMTNEEAIEYLKHADTTVGKKIKTRTAEAIEMAIQSLTAISELSKSLKAVNRYEMDERVLIGFNMAVAIFNNYFGEESCALKNEQTDGDLISREALLKELSVVQNRPVHTAMKIIKCIPTVKVRQTDGDLISRDYVLSKFKEQCDRCGKYKENNGAMCRCCALDDAIDYVEDAPNIFNGVPIEEKIAEWIPVSERLPEDGRHVLIYAWNVHHVIARYDEFRTENGYKKCWVTADAWNGNTKINHEVIAWMPLPEPYKED